MKKILTFTLALLVTVTLAACSGGTSAAASTIAIDVNPSVVLELDENDRVINVILNNEDAEIIVGDMDLIGVDYNVALNALLGSMVANGYINELANSVLLSIQSDDETRESDLMAELSQAINDYLTGNSIDGSVITQSLEFDADAEQLAEELGISEAKAELILDIIEIDPRMVVEELAALSINDLNLLLEAKNYVMDDVEKSGSASQLDLITAEEAYQAALLEFGVEETAVVEFEVELEQEDGIMVYEVEIETADDEFEVLIHAKEGTVYVEMDEDDDDDDDEDDVFPADALTEEEVMTLVAAELGLDASLITELEVEQEIDNGVAYYEIEFEYGDTEYELEVDAVTGEFYTNSMDVDGYDYDDDDDEYDDDEDDEDDDDDSEDDSEDNTEDDTTDTEEDAEDDTV